MLWHYIPQPYCFFATLLSKEGKLGSRCWLGLIALLGPERLLLNKIYTILLFPVSKLWKLGLRFEVLSDKFANANLVFLPCPPCSLSHPERIDKGRNLSPVINCRSGGKVRTTLPGREIKLVYDLVKFVPAAAYHILPQLACNILATTYKYYFSAQYRGRQRNASQ